MKAAFPAGFISMAPAADTDTASLASNSTSSKSLSHSGPINAGNDTYKFYDGDGGDGWPGMEQWVDFYSMWVLSCCLLDGWSFSGADFSFKVGSKRNDD
jgi:hypothetical protein